MRETEQILSQLKLISAIKANDNGVLKRLYQDNYKKVEVFILKNNGSMPQAKDTYQEAFIAMYQNVKAGKFSPISETALQGYLYQIAKNKWTDFLRSSHFKKTSQIEDGFLIKDEDSILISFDISEDNYNPKNHAMEAFKHLGDECKKLLEIFYFQKKSLREIAVFFNIGEASARNKKYRCIQKLRDLVSPN
ncbi:MAG: sigma-70 family RNA polymerase sigma factor [Flavobacteriaceae bacterium]|nr:sigma-70 family RNA polymerase sigma factor [Flavobacteriaceae bacterium]